MFFRTVSASWFWLALRCKNRKELCGDNEFGSCHIQWQLSFTAACVQDVEEKQMTRVSCKRPSLRKTESGNWTLKPTVITSNPNHRNRRAGHYWEGSQVCSATVQTYFSALFLSSRFLLCLFGFLLCVFGFLARGSLRVLGFLFGFQFLGGHTDVVGVPH